MASLADYLRSIDLPDLSNLPSLPDLQGMAVRGARSVGRAMDAVPDIASSIGSSMAGQSVGGLSALATGATGGDLDEGVRNIHKAQTGLTYQPRDQTAQDILRGAGDVIEPVNKFARENIADPIGDRWPVAGAAVTAIPELLPGPKGLKGAVSGLGRVAKAAKAVDRGVGAAEAVAPAVEAVARSRGALAPHFPDDPDIVNSLLNNPRYKETGQIPPEDIALARSDRAYSRAEPPSLPKPAAQMSDADWQAWGAQHGVDMTVTPSQSLGVSDIATRRELKVPGGLEGKFTVPDLFQIKSDNFDPTALGQDLHTDLMKKFLRTFERPGGTDPVDKFNALNFSLLSPNAPLGPNEFLAQRFRVRSPEELSQVADTPKELLSMDERGMGSASRGGMGVKGTADLGNMQQLAQLLRDKPEMFDPGEGETLRDVARRVMNQVPGLGPKTASLGVPWFDLDKANTSAVDLHMIKHYYPQMMTDPELGEDFTRAIGGLAGMPGTSSADLLQRAAADPKFKALLDEKAIKIIGGNEQSSVYRTKSGDLNPDVHPSLAPDKLAFEPQVAKDFGPYYSKVVDYVDASRGSDPSIELFPEQWRKWDTIRGRIEPHEMAHPDFRNLPRMSWEELQAAKQANQEAGYFGGSPEQTPGKVPWGRLYYGKADPLLLGGVAAGTAGGISLANVLRGNDKEAQR